MALWGLSQSIGYLIWINIDLIFDWKKYFVVAALFLILAFIDLFTFVGHPAQVNMFIEDGENSLKEKAQFDQLYANAALMRSRAQSLEERKISVFELMDMKKLKITFLMTAENKEVFIIILSAGFRIAAWQIG